MYPCINFLFQIVDLLECDFKPQTHVHDINQVTEVLVVLLIRKSVLKHERGQIHEPKTPGFGGIVRSISVNVRKFPNKGSWNVSDHICSLLPNLFPHCWCNLVVAISNIKTFVFSHPQFDQRWNNILKKEMHPIPWIALCEINR